MTENPLTCNCDGYAMHHIYVYEGPAKAKIAANGTWLCPKCISEVIVHILAII